MPPLRLQHLHLPSLPPSHFPPYSLASKLQSLLRRQHLDHKDSSSSPSSNPPPPPPQPTLISFTPLPIYTLGRRQSTPLPPSEISRLSQPLSYQSATLPVVTAHSPRGGLTTYHGPGQVVLWPVLDIHSKSHKTFTVRCYSRLLENVTISTLEKMFGIRAFTTDDPGVWTRVGGGQGEERKIAALGVHLRRHVSGLGTAVNVDMPGAGVADEGVNPWKRIVACGIEGREVTSVREQIGRQNGGILRGTEEVADGWAGELARRIEVEGVEKISGGKVVRLLEEAISKSEEGEERGEGEYLDYARKRLEEGGGWVEEALDRGV